jgi:hypothetical protein
MIEKWDTHRDRLVGCIFYFRGKLSKIHAVDMYLFKVCIQSSIALIHLIIKNCQGGVQSWLLIGVNDSKSSICVPQTSLAD